MENFPKLVYIILIKISAGFLKSWQTDSKIYVEIQRIDKAEQIWKIQYTWFPTYCKAIIAEKRGSV